jgi:lipoprotein
MKIQSILSVGAGLLLLMASVTGCNREESKNPSADAASVAASTGTSVHTAPAADEPGTTTQTESTTSAGGKTNGTKAKTTVAATRTAAPTTAPTKTEKPKKEYYSSAVGMWYTVWWDSKEADAQYYEHHWLKETRVKPLKHGYYAADDPAKLQDDFTYFNRIGIDYLILDDTNNHMADGGNIASHINACFKKAKELGNKAPKLCFAGGSPLLGGNEEGMIGEMDIFYGYANMYKDNTFFWKGKPLFVNFNSPNNYGWQDPKGRFTMRPAAGHTSEGKGYIQKYGLDKIGMYGWVFDYQYNTSEVYGISPGWSRSHNGLSSGSPPPIPGAGQTVSGGVAGRCQAQARDDRRGELERPRGGNRHRGRAAARAHRRAWAGGSVLLPEHHRGVPRAENRLSGRVVLPGGKPDEDLSVHRRQAEGRGFRADEGGHYRGAGRLLQLGGRAAGIAP